MRIAITALALSLIVCTMVAMAGLKLSIIDTVQGRNAALDCITDMECYELTGINY